MLNAYIGEIAALATALFWSATAVFFSIASRRAGAVRVNRIRLLTALIFLIVTHVLLTGQLLPRGAGAERWFWLGLSGIVGLALGDACLFQSYVEIGARLGSLMMSLAPVLSALLAGLFLRERLAPLQWLGIFVTVAGVAWVISEDGNNGKGQSQSDGKQRMRGILLGVGAATGQAVGLVLSKIGLGSDFSALSGNLIRVLCAACAIWLLAMLQKQARPTLEQVGRDPATLRATVLGAFFGPFIGVWLSLFAVQRTAIGIASTLIALPPVFLVPISHFVFHERISWQAIAGTIVAFAGVGLLFLS
jgi:drug/metabolite transporter (DMT)-like permease